MNEVAHAYKNGELAIKITNTGVVSAFEQSDEFEVERL